MPSTYSVSEHNASPTTSVSGSLSLGAGFIVQGISYAGSSSIGVGQAFAGTYGSIVLNANGTFVYTLNNADPDTNVLGAGMIGSDRFTYTYSLNGITQTATVIFQINGVDEPNQVVAATATAISIDDDTVLGSLDQVRSTSQYGAMVYGVYGERLSFTNNGALFVDSVPYSSMGVGFWGQAPGDIINNGLIDVVGHHNDATGVNLWLNSILTNNGVIRVVADRAADPNSGSFAGQARGVGGGPIVNAGTIEVQSAGMAIGVMTGTVDNSGLIYVSGNASVDWVYGISASGTNAVINNSGTIHAVSTGGGETVGISIFPDNINVYQYGTVINSGTIVATTAIRAIEGYSTGIHVINSGRIEGNLLFDSNLNMVTNALGGVWVGDLQFGYDTDVSLNQGTIFGNVSLGGGDDLFDGRGGTVTGTVDGGAGRDFIFGGSAGDRLSGGDGDDRIVGGGGADALYGGNGADVFAYTAVSDSTAAAQDTISGFQTGTDKLDFGALQPSQVNITTSGGFTIVTATVGSSTMSIRVQGTVVPTDLIVLPQTIDTATPNDDFITPIVNYPNLLGYAGNDLLHGGAAAEWLDGGSGLDIMFGGGGDDIYIIDNDGDRVIELSGGGTDQVQTTIDYSLQAFVENGVLLGSSNIGLLGNNLDNHLRGNSGQNVLRGGGGNDIIIGGLGFDAIEGGIGADRFVYESAMDASGPAGDRLIGFEHGVDIIDLSAVGPLSYQFVEMPDASWGMFPWVSFMSHWTQVTVTTASGDVMTLWVQGQATLADFSENAPLSGTGINDVLIGSSVANVISGQGGNDTLTGGAGNDTFQDTKAGLSGDTITDFAVGDRIVFTDATLAGFTFSLSGSTLTYSGGSLTLTGVAGTLVASAAAGGGVQLMLQTTPFANESLVLTAFGSSAGGWTSDDKYPRLVADVNGDGRADIVGFGNDGVFVALGNANGSFNPSQVASLNFGFSPGAGGWTSNNTYPRLLADVNGDNRADIVAFGEGGTYVALGQANGTFGPAIVASGSFGRSTPAGGWTSDDKYPRLLGDVNGDGRADIVGFGNDGVYVALGQANGTFAAATVASANFGYSTGAGGWTSDNIYPRQLADVNGDNRADIIGFGEGGTYVALGQANGTFGPAAIASGEFGRSTAAGGWTSNDVYYRELADVNGDNRADIVGFGQSAVYVALGQANGTFGSSQVGSGNFGAGPEAGGWSSQDTFPRHLADVNNDGFADIVGFGANGVYVALANGGYLM